MQAFEQQHSKVPFLVRHRVAASVLGVLLVAGVAFGAVGGAGLIRSWLMTMEVNGELVEVREISVEEDGSTRIDVPLDLRNMEPGDEVALTFEGAAGEGTTNVTVDFADGSGRATILMGGEQVAEIKDLPTDAEALNLIFASQPSNERLAELLGDQFDPDHPGESLAAFLKSASQEEKLRVLSALCGKDLPVGAGKTCQAQIVIGSCEPKPPAEPTEPSEPADPQPEK